MKTLVFRRILASVLGNYYYDIVRYTGIPVMCNKT